MNRHGLNERFVAYYKKTVRLGVIETEVGFRSRFPLWAGKKKLQSGTHFMLVYYCEMQRPLHIENYVRPQEPLQELESPVSFMLGLKASVCRRLLSRFCVNKSCCNANPCLKQQQHKVRFEGYPRRSVAVVIDSATLSVVQVKSDLLLTT